MFVPRYMHAQLCQVHSGYKNIKPTQLCTTYADVRSLNDTLRKWRTNVPAVKKMYKEMMPGGDDDLDNSNQDNSHSSEDDDDDKETSVNKINEVVDGGAP